MKIYVVCESDYGFASAVIKAFYSREAAEAFCDNVDGNYVAEVELEEKTSELSVKTLDN
jgi:viroplasmin and RNaseH domain-containing protein